VNLLILLCWRIYWYL